MQAKATGGSWSAGGRQPEPEWPPPTRASGDSSKTWTWPAFTYTHTHTHRKINGNNMQIILQQHSLIQRSDKIYLFNSGLSLFQRHVGMDTRCFQLRRNPRELRKDDINKPYLQIIHWHKEYIKNSLLLHFHHSSQQISHHLYNTKYTRIHTVNQVSTK